MASARTSNGMPEYDGTRWRLIPELNAHPQDAFCHEVPLYMAMKEGEWAFAIHGPQDPRDIGREVNVRLPARGPNPNTGTVRLPFGLREDGFEYAKPVPFVHHLLVQWRIPNQTLNGGPMFAHLEGGMTIFQVAAKTVWYVGTWMSKAQQGYGLDPKALKTYRANSINVNGKIIFVRRVITLPSGEQYETGELTSAAAGGPSTIKLSHLGHPDYPKFPNLVMTIQSAKFNARRYPLLTACLNRQGFLCSHNKHIEIMNGIQSPADLILAEDWDRYDVGDDLTPHADVEAPIQTQHAGVMPPDPVVAP
jgi:hypothetical protein